MSKRKSWSRNQLSNLKLNQPSSCRNQNINSKLKSCAWCIVILKEFKCMKKTVDPFNMNFTSINRSFEKKTFHFLQQSVYFQTPSFRILLSKRHLKYQTHKKILLQSILSTWEVLKEWNLRCFGQKRRKNKKWRIKSWKKNDWRESENKNEWKD